MNGELHMPITFSKAGKNRIHYLRQSHLFLVGVCIFLGCSREDIRLQVNIPGYKTALQFSDSFDADLDSWVLEGNGRIEITKDNRLQTMLLSSL